ncbi:hypothetical protein [Mesorhizobium sp. M1E.F.Ca.ET.041.01.1.1]|uniref:hypothetical protein n=1 Tax=Mesorhizobium sp. M1E.F.Ca.ET.041.01.1.1 TaxID=2496759 RepID=UPI0016775903|nr:hypothetical protein [Mesorhizobium sp. M1E.F.Ca.ET.041.01.1.1]
MLDRERHEIWQFYWIHQIPVAEIAEAYGLPSRSDAASMAAGPAFFRDLICENCGEHIAVTSRECFKRFFVSRYPWPRRCDDCQRAWLESYGERWHEP